MFFKFGDNEVTSKRHLPWYRIEGKREAASKRHLFCF